MKVLPIVAPLTARVRYAQQDRTAALEAALAVVKQRLINGGMLPRRVNFFLETLRGRFETADSALVALDPPTAFGVEMASDENGRLQCGCKNYANRDYVSYGAAVCGHTVAYAIEQEIAAYFLAKAESPKGIVLLGEFISARLSAVR